MLYSFRDLSITRLGRCNDLMERNKTLKVRAIEPNADTAALLTGAQFSDAFTVTIDGAAFPARHAAERMLGRSPRWIRALMALRDYLVTPFGLKKSPSAATYADTVGIFPVLSDTPNRLVAGFDDAHLDFRFVVDVASSGEGQRVIATTLVLTHNRLGRVYLAIIMPFHRLIVRAMLRQVAA
jgi:hypothetical protein